MNLPVRSAPIFYRGNQGSFPQARAPIHEPVIIETQCDDEVKDKDIFKKLATKSTNKVREWFRDQLEESSEE